MKKVIVGIIALSLFAAAGCDKSSVGEQLGSAEEGAAAVPEKSVSVASVAIGEKSWAPIEIATTVEERENGLGGRDSLDADSGMLFIFPDPPGEVTLPFWMKDMKFDLDMIFINKDKQVVFVERNAPAGSAELIEPPASYLYVLEVNAGDAADVKPGDTLTISMP
jgi:uncharacterized membrane protein (UPF0127 family)